MLRVTLSRHLIRKSSRNQYIHAWPPNGKEDFPLCASDCIGLQMKMLYSFFNPFEASCFKKLCFYNTFWPSGFKMLCFTILLLHAKCIKPQNHWFYNTFSACGPLKLQNALFYNIFAANPSRQASNCFVLQYFRFGKVGPYH